MVTSRGGTVSNREGVAGFSRPPANFFHNARDTFPSEERHNPKYSKKTNN